MSKETKFGDFGEEWGPPIVVFLTKGDFGIKVLWSEVDGDIPSSHLGAVCWELYTVDADSTDLMVFRERIVCEVNRIGRFRMSVESPCFFRLRRVGDSHYDTLAGDVVAKISVEDKNMSEERLTREIKAKQSLLDAVARNKESNVTSLPVSSVSHERGLQEAQEGWDLMEVWDPRLREDEEKWQEEFDRVKKYKVLDPNPCTLFYGAGCLMRTFGFTRPINMRNIKAFNAWSDINLSKCPFELFGRNYIICPKTEEEIEKNE